MPHKDQDRDMQTLPTGSSPRSKRLRERRRPTRAWWSIPRKILEQLRYYFVETLRTVNNVVCLHEPHVFVLRSTQAACVNEYMCFT